MTRLRHRLAAAVAAGWIGVSLPCSAPAQPRALPAPPEPPPAGFTYGVTYVEPNAATETTKQIMERQRQFDLLGLNPVRIKAEKGKPERPLDPVAPGSPFTSTWPPEAGEYQKRQFANPQPRAPQTIDLEIAGPTLTDTTGAFPPDTMGAVGPTQFIIAVNGRIRSYNKTTGAADGVINATMDAFFNSVRNGERTSDPRIRYDRHSGRWIVVMINVTVNGVGTITADNRVLIAVSDSGTITSSTVWTYSFFTNNTTLDPGNVLADYPTLGIDEDALYIGVNQFTTSSFVGCTGWVVQKSTLPGLGTGGPVVTTFENLLNGSFNGPYTPQGVDNFDSGTNEGYFIGVDGGVYGRLVLRRVANPGSASPSISGNLDITVPATTAPISVPNQASAQNADGLDDRLYAAVARNGSIWTAHSFAVNASGIAAAAGGRNGARWYQVGNIVSPATPSLTQSGTVYDPAASNPRSYWIPAISVSGQGHAALGFSIGGTGISYQPGATGRLATDPLGTMQNSGAAGDPAPYETSTATYNPAGDSGNPNRWGDYSFTCVDPNDDMTMWTIQQMCHAANTYRVQAARLRAPAPTLDNPGASVAQGTAGYVLNLTGTGLFDPGSSFPNRLAVSVSGTGVTVNSVTWTNATTASANITVAGGATLGPRDVTVTNPDGQTSTATGGLTITAGGVATVTNVTSALANGAYTTGTNVDIGVTFSAPVTVSGSPLLALNTTPARNATYLSGSGSSDLIFRYTVVAGDTSIDLDYTSTGALSLNGGTINGPGAIPATLTLAAPGSTGSLGFNKNIVIDTTAPTVSIAAVTASPTNANALQWTADFSESVGATFSTADLTIDGTLAATPSISGPAAGDIYTITLTPTNPNADGTLGFTITGATVADLATNPMATNASSSLITVDNTAPTAVVTALTASPTNANAAQWTVDFSESVGATFTTADLTLTGSIPGGASFGISGPAAGDVYTVTLTPTNPNADGTVGFSIGTAVSDAAANAFAGATSSNVTFDNTAPTVTLTRLDPTTTALDAVRWSAVFSENVGASFAIGDVVPAGTVAATVTGFTANTPGIDYTITLTATDGNANGTLSFSIAAGAFQDAATNGSTAIANAPAYTIDNTAASIASVSTTTANGTYGIAASVNVRLTFTSAVNVTGTPRIELNTTPTPRFANYTGGTGTTTLSFSYTVVAGDSSADLNYASVGALTLNGGTIVTVSNGNAATLTLPNPAGAGSLGQVADIAIDGVAPTIVLLAPALTQPNPAFGLPIEFTIQFSEPVSGLTAGDFNLAGSTAPGVSITSIVPLTGPSATYSVFATATGDGDVTLSLNAATVQDAGNNTNAAGSSASSVTYNAGLGVPNWSRFE